MTDVNVPLFETFEAALAEFMKDGSVSAVRCERCEVMIEIAAPNQSGMIVRCSCGAYNDNLRGLCGDPVGSSGYLLTQSMKCGKSPPAAAPKVGRAALAGERVALTQVTVKCSS